MRPDLYGTFDPDRPHTPESVAKLVGKIHSLLARHTRSGRAHSEIGQAMTIALAHMVINASRYGFGSLDEIKNLACANLGIVVDVCWRAENTHMGARPTVSDVGHA
jgi:hypothetical protein